MSENVIQATPGPDVEPLAESGTRRSGRRSRTFWVVTLLLVLIAVAGSLVVAVRKADLAARRSQTIHHLKQVGLALQEFEADYDRFPDATTIAAVKGNTSSTWTLGADSSNQLFRQLILTGLVREEAPFSAPVPWAHPPDNDVRDEAHALAPGECAFAYVPGRSPADAPGSPLLLLAAKPGTGFDLGRDAGTPITLRLDHSADVLPGWDLSDPAKPSWQGKVLDVKWPETLPR